MTTFHSSPARDVAPQRRPRRLSPLPPAVGSAARQPYQGQLPTHTGGVGGLSRTSANRAFTSLALREKKRVCTRGTPRGHRNHGGKPSTHLAGFPRAPGIFKTFHCFRNRGGAYSRSRVRARTRPNRTHQRGFK